MIKFLLNLPIRFFESSQSFTNSVATHVFKSGTYAVPDGHVNKTLRL